MEARQSKKTIGDYFKSKKRTTEYTFVQNSDRITDTTHQDILDSKVDILNTFTQFVILKQKNQLNYTNLSEKQLAILNETKLNLGLPVRANEFYVVMNILKDELFVVYHSCSDFIVQKGSSELALANGRSKIYTWDELPKVDFDFSDINIMNSLLNLSNYTHLRHRAPEREEKLEILSSLVPDICKILELASTGHDIEAYLNNSNANEHDYTEVQDEAIS